MRLNNHGWTPIHAETTRIRRQNKVHQIRDCEFRISGFGFLSDFGAFGFRTSPYCRPLASRFFLRSSAVILLETPSAGTSIFAVQRIALSTNLRTLSLPQALW